MRLPPEQLLSACTDHLIYIDLLDLPRSIKSNRKTTGKQKSSYKQQKEERKHGTNKTRTDWKAVYMLNIFITLIVWLQGLRQQEGLIKCWTVPLTEDSGGVCPPPGGSVTPCLLPLRPHNKHFSYWAVNSLNRNMKDTKKKKNKKTLINQQKVELLSVGTAALRHFTVGSFSLILWFAPSM